MTTLLMNVTAERTAHGICRTYKSGKTALVCSRCEKAGAGRALAFYNETPWLDPALTDHLWLKTHGVYDQVKQKRNMVQHRSRPAEGSKVRCHVCQWVMIVPGRDPAHD